jgi:hypothetical protein
MDCITIDFETFFSTDYSLSKMTTEAYIRDPRFEVILAGVKINDTPAFWLLPDRFDQFVRHEVDWKNTAVIMHHAHFDSAILSWHYDVRPAMHIDTLSMARVLDGPKAGNSLYDLCIRHGIGMKGDYVTFAKGKHAADFTAAETRQYGQYCVNDCERTYDLAQIFLEQMPADELKLIDLTIRMFTEPKLLGNEAKLRGAVLTEQKRKRDLLTDLGYSCKACNGSGQALDVVGNPAPCKACDGAGIDKKPFNSSDKFAEILRAIGVEPKTKPSPSTGEPIYAFARTDAAMQEMLESPDEVVAALAEARVSIKSGIVETRAQRFADMASRGPLAVYLKYGGAHTFRWSGGDACLVADTVVTIFDAQKGAIRKRIIDVLLDDLVWDGEEFVQHAGVKFSGFAEVMSFDSITGTPDHVVFTDTYGAVALAEAASRGAKIMDCPEPAVQGVIPLAAGPEFPPHWGAGMKVPVYDIVNCGPRHRFGANGKLVHNCNFQNMSNHNENRPELAVLKQSIYAPDGYRIVCSDSAQGEARLLAWAAGQHDLVEAFAQGRDVYSEHASTVYRRPIDRKRNPADKIPGHVGKVCLAEGTLVVTNTGTKPIERVTIADMLWDGEQWVQHQGLIFQGVKQTFGHAALWATGDHEILTERGWVEWRWVITSRSLFQSALSSASLPFSGGGDALPHAETMSTDHSVGAPAGQKPMSRDTRYSQEDQHGAMSARKRRPRKSVGGATQKLWRILSIGRDFLVGWPPPLIGATALRTRTLSTTGSGGLQFPLHGARIKPSFSAMSKRAPGGITQRLRWIGRMLTAAMNPATSALSPAPKICETNAKSLTCNAEFKNLKRKLPTYDLACAGPRHRFTVLTDQGPIIVHNCILSLGFGSGYLKAATEFLKGALGAKPIVFTAADMTALQIDPSPFMNNPKHVHKVTEMPSRLSLNDRLIHCCVTKALVDRYRQRYPAIVAFWGYMDQIIGHMMRGDVVSFGPGGIMTTGKDFILMPNGLKLNYHSIERSDTGEATYFDGRSRTKIYGSLLVENCLNAATIILTSSGRKPIVDVTTTDLIWDGVEWAAHSGVVCRGARAVIDFGGVSITPEHEVLVDERWIPAGRTTYEEAASSFERHYGRATRHACGAGVRGEQRSEVILEIPMRLRGCVREVCHSVLSRAHQIMRVLNSTAHLGGTDYPRNVAPPSVCSMEVDARPLQAPNPSGLAQLRWAGYHGLHAVARVVRELLGGHGPGVPAGANPGSGEQRRGVLQAELPMDYAQRANPEHTRKPLDPHPAGGDASMASGRGIWYREDHPAVSSVGRMARRADVPAAGQAVQEVYDILNAGPRQRFAVQGADGRLILVHNCIQSLHRVIVGEQMLEIAKELDVVLMTHDEITCVVEESAAELALQYMNKVLATPPKWAAGLPLAGDGGIGVTYADC